MQDITSLLLGTLRRPQDKILDHNKTHTKKQPGNSGRQSLPQNVQNYISSKPIYKGIQK